MMPRFRLPRYFSPSIDLRVRELFTIDHGDPDVEDLEPLGYAESVEPVHTVGDAAEASLLPNADHVV